MLLYAALVPPREILDDLWSVVVPVEDAPAPEPRRGRRAARRRQKPGREVSRPAPVLDVAAVAHAQVTICKFGNLALVDANRLTAALTQAATQWSSPRLRLAGYSTLESEADPSIWVDLGGDLEALTTVARGVTDVAKRLSLFVDRRTFQPRVRLASVSRTATESELETVLARLARFETNAWWQTGIALFTPVDQGTEQASYRIFADIPLGPHVVH